MGCFRTGGIASGDADQREDGARNRSGDEGTATGRRTRRLGSSASSSASPTGRKAALARGRGAAAAARRRMVVGMRALNLIFSEARRSLSLTFTSRAAKAGYGDEGKGGPANPDAENKSWLLADARAEQEDHAAGPAAPFAIAAAAAEEATAAMADQHSVHSSFRFSFGSQLEVEPTVLMVSEDEQQLAATPSSTSRDHTLLIKWRRLESLERSISPVSGALVRFSFPEIRSATRDFHPGRMLGRGALSRVYRGKVAGRRGTSAVAVKRLQGEEKECAKAFCRELMVASGLRHPNVVPLLGFCVDPQGLFLVYKFVSGGSLDHHLHPEEGGEGEEEGRRRARRRRRRGRWVGGGAGGGLPWALRWKVAVGVARAVEYLHQGTDRCVVHRDIKPSNILLSSNKDPKLCDFGLATWTHGPSLPFLCKTVKGTFGYLAPEYFQHGKLSDKTDIYAFGVLLLELITGRKPIDTNRPQGDENLVLWAKPLLQQGEAAIEELVDSRLKFSSYNQVEISRMVRTAAACLNNEESGRPRISQVVRMLHGTDDNCDDWPVFTGSGCFSGFSPQLQDPQVKSDMRDHLTLAMLGISDEEDDIYGR